MFKFSNAVILAICLQGGTWAQPQTKVRRNTVEFKPATKAELVTAVELYCDDEAVSDTTYGPIAEWDVSEITNMKGLFYRVACSKTAIPGFDPDLSEWKVDKVTTMSEMFRYTAFDNYSLEDWNVENVVNMDGMFKETDFNNDSLKNWKVDKVVNMNGVFEDSSFNGDLSKWDTSNVEDMTSMFDSATFNNDSIKNWKVENVISFEYMFGSNEAFNQDLSKWHVSSAEVFAEMFADASAFNQQLCWDVSSATDTYDMFRDAGGGGLLECCSTYNPIDSGNYKVEELNLIDGECPTKAPSKKSKKNGKRDFMI